VRLAKCPRCHGRLDLGAVERASLLRIWITTPEERELSAWLHATARREGVRLNTLLVRLLAQARSSYTPAPPSPRSPPTRRHAGGRQVQASRVGRPKRTNAPIVSALEEDHA
jgi:hypothetical protein